MGGLFVDDSSSEDEDVPAPRQKSMSPARNGEPYANHKDPYTSHSGYPSALRKGPNTDKPKHVYKLYRPLRSPVAQPKPQHTQPPPPERHQPYSVTYGLLPVTSPSHERCPSDSESCIYVANTDTDTDTESSQVAKPSKAKAMTTASRKPPRPSGSNQGRIPVAQIGQPGTTKAAGHGPTTTTDQGRAPLTARHPAPSSPFPGRSSTPRRAFNSASEGPPKRKPHRRVGATSAADQLSKAPKGEPEKRRRRTRIEIERDNLNDTEGYLGSTPAKQQRRG